MSDAWFAGIDWQAPWLAPYADVGPQAVAMSQTWGSVAHGLNQATQSPRRFVPQQELTHGMAYETFIREQQAIPTRDNLHDFFNGLVWHRWPLVKSRLNELQAQAIARDGVGQQRGPLRDAITLWDENGALLIAPEAIWQALIDRQWTRLFVDLRHLWAQARLWVVGHAFMEQAVKPRKNLTVHVLRTEGCEQLSHMAPFCGSNADSASQWAELDAQVAHRLTPDWLSTKPLTPLPIMGVPGWHTDNVDAAFYEDVQVFRPPRQVLAHSDS